MGWLRLQLLLRPQLLLPTNTTSISTNGQVAGEPGGADIAAAIIAAQLASGYSGSLSGAGYNLSALKIGLGMWNRTRLEGGRNGTRAGGGNRTRLEGGGNRTRLEGDGNATRHGQERVRVGTGRRPRARWFRRYQMCGREHVEDF